MQFARRFGWLSAGEIGWGRDLRRCGWSLAEEGAGGACPLLADGADWYGLLARETRDRVVLLDVADGDLRARLIAEGFGEVLPANAPLAEIAARAVRVAERAGMMPRYRDVPGLTLDLVHRDAFAGGAALGLHPREFALLWRLAESPGVPVGKAELLADVWRLRHVPETNSVAVHVFRLRGKLASAGLADLVQTVPGGGYVLAGQGFSAPFSPFLVTGDSRLDSHTVLREDSGMGITGAMP